MRSRYLLAVLSSLLLLGCCTEGLSAETGPPVIVLYGRVVDGTGLPPIENGAVLVVGHEIVAVGARDEVVVPEGAEIVDVGNSTILPGFINAHVHGVCQPVSRALWARSGVTTVRDMGLPFTPGWQECMSYREDEFVGAHVVWCGPLVTVPGGYPICGRGFPALTVESAEDAKHQVNQLIATGVDAIKITITRCRCVSLSLAEVQAITETAHAQGIPVTAHVETAEDAQRALDGGVDDLAHVPGNTWMSDTLIESLVSEGVSMVSTLAPSYIHDPGVSPPMRDNLRQFAQAGGLIAMGSDAGYLPGLTVGMPMDEIRALHEAGFSPMQIITFATANAAAVCRLSDTLGTLEPGKQADILVVNGDPVADLEALTSTVLVIHRGTIITDRR